MFYHVIFTKTWRKCVLYSDLRLIPNVRVLNDGIHRMIFHDLRLTWHPRTPTDSLRRFLRGTAEIFRRHKGHCVCSALQPWNPTIKTYQNISKRPFGVWKEFGVWKSLCHFTFHHFDVAPLSSIPPSIIQVTLNPIGAARHAKAMRARHQSLAGPGILISTKLWKNCSRIIHEWNRKTTMCIFYLKTQGRNRSRDSEIVWVSSHTFVYGLHTNGAKHQLLQDRDRLDLGK